MAAKGKALSKASSLKARAATELFNYRAHLQTTAKRFVLSAETYNSDKRDQSISSGMLCTDLVLGNAGWVPGMHTSSGMEQGAKSTSAIHSMHEAVRIKTPIIQLWDYEKSFSAEYAYNFWNSAFPDFVFGQQNDKGAWLIEPIIDAYDEHTAEPFFDSLHHLLKGMPRKRKISGHWFLVFEDTKINRGNLDGKYDTALLKTMGVLAMPVSDGRPQGFLMADSYTNMLPGKMDDDEANDSIGQIARMFSKNIPRVKGLVGSRNIVWLGINQMRENPLAMYGPKEVETGGNALKQHSDCRLKHASCATPQPYQNWGNDVKNQMRTEKGLRGGEDTYRFITIDTLKNKVGGAPKGTRIHQRIWVGDEGGVARGLDPVFDTWQYGVLTRQIEGNLKNFKMFIEGSELNEKSMSLYELKVLVLGNKKQKQKVGKKLGLTKDPKVRELFFSQLADGTGYDYFNGKDLLQDDVEDDE